MWFLRFLEMAASGLRAELAPQRPRRAKRAAPAPLAAVALLLAKAC